MRQSAVQTLNVWVEQTGLVVFVEAELFVDALKQENPNLRAEVYVVTLYHISVVSVCRVNISQFVGSVICPGAYRLIRF
jgi:hypothetical protein